MESVIAIASLFGIGYGVFRSGKRIGSRKGFHVGRRSRRRR